MVCAVEEWKRESGGCKRRNGRWEEGGEGKDRRSEGQSERVESLKKAHTVLLCTGAF